MGYFRHCAARGLLATLLALALAAGGCGGRETVVVTDDDDGRSLELSLGDNLRLSLDANPEENLLWVIDHVDQKVLELQSKDLVPCEEENRFGGHQRRVFRFKAKRTGDTRLVLVLVSTAEYGDAPSDEYSLKVKVVK
jgi:predicted secreted protein